MNVTSSSRWPDHLKIPKHLERWAAKTWRALGKWCQWADRKIPCQIRHLQCTYCTPFRIRRKDPESKFAGLPLPALPPIISCSKPCQPDNWSLTNSIKFLSFWFGILLQGIVCFGSPWNMNLMGCRQYRSYGSSWVVSLFCRGRKWVSDGSQCSESFFNEDRWLSFA